MSTKYIFLDVDGTIVNFKGEILPKTVEALKKAHENGHKLIISTGRQQSQVYPWLLELGVFDGVIATAGANVRAEGKTIATHFILKEKLDFLHRYLEDNHIPYAVQTENAMLLEQWCFDEISAYHKKNGVTGKAAESLFGGIKVIDDIRTLNNAEKIAYYAATKRTSEVEKEIGDYFFVNIYSFGNAPDTNGEISVRGCNKASGMREILAYFGGKQEDTFAFGDADNDIDMLLFANVGVAMGNATEALKDNADYITDDIDDAGIYNAFKRYGII